MYESFTSLDTRVHSDCKDLQQNLGSRPKPCIEVYLNYVVEEEPAPNVYFLTYSTSRIVLDGRASVDIDGMSKAACSCRAKNSTYVCTLSQYDEESENRKKKRLCMILVTRRSIDLHYTASAFC